MFAQEDRVEVKKVQRGVGRKAKSSQPCVENRLPRGLGATMAKKCLVNVSLKLEGWGFSSARPGF